MKYSSFNLMLTIVLCSVSFLKSDDEAADEVSETHQSLHATVTSKQGNTSKLKTKSEKKFSHTMENHNERVPLQRTVDDNINNNITSFGRFYEDDYNDVSAMSYSEDDSISSDESYDDDNSDYYIEEGTKEFDNDPISEDQKKSKPNSYNKKGLIKASHKRKSRKSNTNKKSRSTKQAPWEPWGNWSPCSVSCGTGKQTRWRNSVHDNKSNFDKADREMEEKTCQMPACSPLDLLSILIA